MNLIDVMNCFINQTGRFLPGPLVPNEGIADLLGTLPEEEETREKILRMNGIQSRHYALNSAQEATHDLYELGRLAAENCLEKESAAGPAVSYLSAGSTNAPLVGPGLSSLLHDRLSESGALSGPVEINSNSGICTASAQALVNGIRAVASGEHEAALAIGVDQPSEILKSSVIPVPDDREKFEDIRESEWFMSVFLRSMLSDGAGAMLLGGAPRADGLSLQVNWTFSRSFANETPLCMKLDGKTRLLTQDVRILSKHLRPCVRQVMTEGFARNGDDLGSYRWVLPHISSFFFRRQLLGTLREMSAGSDLESWTNLASVGNTGAASIYLMLDEFLATKKLEHGEKVLLFIPESGQFNFVLVSLTAVRA